MQGPSCAPGERDPNPPGRATFLVFEKKKRNVAKKKCGDFFVKKTSPQAHATLLFSFVL
jgi:hypothetical protein